MQTIFMGLMALFVLLGFAQFAVVFFIEDDMARPFSLAILGMTVVAAVGGVAGFRRDMVRSIVTAGEALTALAGRDLSERAVSQEAAHETGLVHREIHHLAEEWRKVIYELLNISSHVAMSTSSVWSSLNRNYKSLDKLKQQTSQVAAASEQISATTMNIARSVSSSVEIARKTAHAATEGKATMDRANAQVTDLTFSTEELTGTVTDLNEAAGEVDDIVQLINDIADQTNLLALNASIEAARAGEQGRGFAVVADEVRKLAEKTLAATADIAARIGKIKAQSRKTAEQMNASHEKLFETVKYIQSMAASLDGIVAHAKAAETEITEIASATEELSSTTEEVSQTMEETARLSDENAGNLMNTFGELDRLSNVVSRLHADVREFTMPYDPLFEIEAAAVGHKNLMQLLFRMLYAKKEINLERMTDHRSCRLSLWYYSQGAKDFGGLAEFKALDGPHKQLHELGGKAVKAWKAGDKAQAQHFVEEVDRLSAEVVKGLEALKERISRKA
jgi:methyl-accepting chemotaxis protein